MNVLGVGINPLNARQTLGVISSVILRGGKGYICATGVHGIMEAQKDPSFRSILNNSLLTMPDGRPTVWMGWLQGFHGMTQLTGPNLMLDVCRMSSKAGFRNFLYGGDVGVAEQLKSVLMARFPGLQIVGTYTPPFRPRTVKEENELICMVQALSPDIFWVGLSTPKQERFMAKYLPILRTKIMLGVGAAFDIHTGRIQDSPEWVKHAGLQWLHRLSQEPRRLWKRYLYNNPRFIVQVTSQLLGLRRYDATGLLRTDD